MHKNCKEQQNNNMKGYCHERRNYLDGTSQSLGLQQQKRTTYAAIANASKRATALGDGKG